MYMKRVLVISYYWPPSGGSGVQRWVKMCKYLPSLGWQPVVYTPENPALIATDSTLEADIPPQVEVIRRPIFEPGQFAKKSTGAQVTPINAQKKTLKQRIAMWIRGNVFIPDPRVLWVLPSVNYLKKYLREHPVDAIVSTGPPQSMHLIAQRLSKALDIPWIADFRDPWTKMFYFKHLSLNAFSYRRHVRLEKSVLDDADMVVAVSPLVQRDFEAMTSTRVELITNGYDEDDFQTAEQASVSGPFTITHAGLFASDGNPECVWQAVASLKESNPAFASNFRIVLAGKTDRQIIESIEAAGLKNNLTDLGYIDHACVVGKMMESTVLMLPLRKEPEYKATIPGKLFEYLASRRPVLGIGQKDGAMASILASARAGETFGWDETEAVKAWIEDKFIQWSNGQLRPADGEIRKYTRRELARQYAALLDKLTEK